MRNVDDLILEAIEDITHPYKNPICKYINVSTKTQKLFIENQIVILLVSNKIRNKKQCR